MSNTMPTAMTTEKSTEKSTAVMSAVVSTVVSTAVALCWLTHVLFKTSIEAALVIVIGVTVAVAGAGLRALEGPDGRTLKTNRRATSCFHHTDGRGLDGVMFIFTTVDLILRSPAPMHAGGVCGDHTGHQRHHHHDLQRHHLEGPTQGISHM